MRDFCVELQDTTLSKKKNEIHILSETHSQLNHDMNSVTALPQRPFGQSFAFHSAAQAKVYVKEVPKIERNSWKCKGLLGKEPNKKKILLEPAESRICKIDLSKYEPLDAGEYDAYLVYNAQEHKLLDGAKGNLKTNVVRFIIKP